ncbi:hypothetical protein, partial [Leptospira interrogans]
MNKRLILWLVIIKMFSCTLVEKHKANLIFNFQEGFNGEEVILFVNEKKIFENKSLITDPRLGVAGASAVENIHGLQKTELFINGKSVSRFDIFIDSDTFIGYNLYSGADFTIIISK